MWKMNLLVCRLFPAVIFETAARINGVTSFPFIPAFSASASASLIDSFMSESVWNFMFHTVRLRLAIISRSVISITVHSVFFFYRDANEHS